MQGVGDDEQAEEEYEDLLPSRQHRPPHRLCRLLSFSFLLPGLSVPACQIEI